MESGADRAPSTKTKTVRGGMFYIGTVIPGTIVSVNDSLRTENEMLPR